MGIFTVHFGSFSFKLDQLILVFFIFYLVKRMYTVYKSSFMWIKKISNVLNQLGHLKKQKWLVEVPCIENQSKCTYWLRCLNSELNEKRIILPNKNINNKSHCNIYDIIYCFQQWYTTFLFLSFFSFLYGFCHPLFPLCVSCVFNYIYTKYVVSCRQMIK